MKLNIQLFAASKSTTFTEPAITDAMISGNYTNLKIKITFSANNNTTYFNNKTLKVNVNGIEKSASVSLSKGGSVVKEFTYTNIVHDTEPKVVHWYWSCATGTSVLGTITQSGDRTLQTLYRIAEYTGQKITGSDTTPTTLTITYDVYSMDYDYYIEYGNRKVQLNPTGTSNTETITIGNNFFNSYPSQSFVPFLDFNLTTYDGDKKLGSDNVQKTIYLDPDAVPTISYSAITEANTTMQSLNWGVFVQNKSQLSLVVTASGINGSTINSLSTTIEGKTYNQLYNLSQNVIETPIITTSGTNTISSSVIDSRNRTNTDSTTYSVEPYSNPSITSFEVQRCLSDGTLDKNGTYLKYSVEGSISPVANNNAKLFRLGYKGEGDNSYTYVTLGTAYTLSISNQISSFTITSSLTYDIVVEAIDSFTTTAINRTIDVGFDLLNFNPSGKAMAIGKVSTASSNQELLEVGLNTTFDEDVSVTGTINQVGSLASLTTTDKTDVVSAINEVDGKIKDFVTDTFVLPISSLAAGGTKELTYNIAKSGYTPIAISGYSIGYSAMNVYILRITSDTEAQMNVRNMYTNTASNVNARIYVLYIKS